MGLFQPRNIFNCFLYVPAIIILAAGLIGCSTPLNHVGAFSKATEDLSQKVSSAYSDVNELTIERRIAAIAADPEESPTPETFEFLIGAEAINLRKNLLSSVEKYARSLGELANAEFRKDIDAASTDLYEALGDLQNTYVKETKNHPVIEDKELVMIAAAVDGIGTLIVEKKRRTAIKEIVIKTDPLIQNTMALVLKEVSGFNDYVLTSLGTIETEMIVAYQDEASGLSVNDRIERLRQINRFHQVKSATPKLLTDINSACQKIASSHLVLRKSVEKDSFTNKELVKEIQELAAIADSINDFYKELAKK